MNDLLANVTGTVLGLLGLRLLAELFGPPVSWFALPGSALAGPGEGGN